MSDKSPSANDPIEVQKNNPLHGLKLEVLLTQLVDHYGWDVLAGAININCFKSNPSIQSSLKFLRRTQWAREKVEVFYLYKYKRLPKPSDAQYELPPRDRTIPLDQKPGTPAEITAPEPCSDSRSKFGSDRPSRSEGRPRSDRNTRSESHSSETNSSGEPKNAHIWGTGKNS